MKPWKTIATETPPHGEQLILQVRDGEYQLRVGGNVLMGSRQHASEEAMARVACRDLPQSRPRVLIGGLGFGFTLRAALDTLPARAEVTIAELSPEVVAMNRGVLAPLAQRPLDDPRVQVEVSDVQEVLARDANRFDAVLLDVDKWAERAHASSQLRSLQRSGFAACLSRAVRARGARRLVGWTRRAVFPPVEGCGFSRRGVLRGRCGRRSRAPCLVCCASVRCTRALEAIRPGAGS